MVGLHAVAQLLEVRVAQAVRGERIDGVEEVVRRGAEVAARRSDFWKAR